MDLSAQIDTNTVIVGDPTVTNRQIIKAKDQQRNFRATPNIDQIGIVDMYRVFHPTTW
jgi:hypothetical protein